MKYELDNILSAIETTQSHVFYAEGHVRTRRAGDKLRYAYEHLKLARYLVQDAADYERIGD